MRQNYARSKLPGLSSDFFCPCKHFLLSRLAFLVYPVLHTRNSSSISPRSRFHIQPHNPIANISERALVLIVGTIQFINIVDFMMVMPLAPDFATELGIPTAHIGWIGGSYTAAAAIAAIVGASFIDRFDRRRAIVIAMLGLAFGTAAGAFATGFYSLLAARMVAGIFGGPASSLAVAMIIDQIPPARRGRALGAVMGAFSAASILGVPAALELARLGSWQLPFVTVASTGLLVAIGAWFLLPPMMPSHSGPVGTAKLKQFLSFFTRRAALWAYATTAAGMFAAFLIIPNISAFVQFNLRYPREHLGMLYLVGGAASFFAMRLAGRLTDRYGSTPVATGGTLLLVITIYLGFYSANALVPVLTIFVGFMVAMSIRNIATTTLTTRVPGNHERAGFMSINSAVQNVASALGAIVSSLLLETSKSGALTGMPVVALLAMLFAAASPFLIHAVHNQVKRSENTAPDR